MPAKGGAAAAGAARHLALAGCCCCMRPSGRPTWRLHTALQAGLSPQQAYTHMPNNNLPRGSQ